MILDVVVSAGIGLAVSIFTVFIVVMASTALAGRMARPKAPSKKRPSWALSPEEQQRHAQCGADLSRVLLRNFLESRRN